MLSLDQWQSMLTVLMPSLVQPGCLSAWTQVSRILELTLSEMTEWVLMSKSVSNHRMSPLRRNETDGNHHWKPSKLFNSRLTRIRGSIWRTPDGYRIQIPVNAWMEYHLKSSSIPFDQLHDFKQLTWAFYSQLDQTDFHIAVQDAMFYDQLHGIDQLAEYIQGTPSHFVHIAMGMGTYEQINKWINKDLWYNPPYAWAQFLEITPPSPLGDKETIDVSDDSETPPPSTSCSSSVKSSSHERGSSEAHETQRRNGNPQHCRQCAAQGLARLSAMNAQSESPEQQTLTHRPLGYNSRKTIAQQGRICYRNWDFRYRDGSVRAKSPKK